MRGAAAPRARDQWANRILGSRAVVHQGRRGVFRIPPDPKRLDWVGDGSGEKGYRYR